MPFVSLSPSGWYGRRAPAYVSVPILFVVFWIRFLLVVLGLSLLMACLPTGVSAASAFNFGSWIGIVPATSDSGDHYSPTTVAAIIQVLGLVYQAYNGGHFIGADNHPHEINLDQYVLPAHRPFEDHLEGIANSDAPIAAEGLNTDSVNWVVRHYAKLCIALNAAVEQLAASSEEAKTSLEDAAYLMGVIQRADPHMTRQRLEGYLDANKGRPSGVSDAQNAAANAMRDSIKGSGRGSIHAGDIRDGITNAKLPSWIPKWKGTHTDSKGFNADLETWLAELARSSPPPKPTLPEDAPPIRGWHATAVSCGVEHPWLDTVKDQASFENAVIGWSRALAERNDEASSSSAIADGIIKGLQGLQLGGSGNLSKSLADCLASCPPPFEGICSKFFDWKQKMERALSTEWASKDADGSRALAVLLGCLCGTLADWAWQQQDHLKRVAAGAGKADHVRTFGEAMTSLFEALRQQLNVDDAEIQLQHQIAWDCLTVNEKCWSAFKTKVDVIAGWANANPHDHPHKVFNALPRPQQIAVRNMLKAWNVKFEKMTYENIESILHDTWVWRQSPPSSSPCRGTRNEDGSCPKGKGDACKCRPFVAALSSPRSFPPSCGPHRFTPADAFANALAQKKELKDNAPAWGKWAHQHGLCEMCMGVKDDAVFRSHWPNENPGGRRDSRSPSRQ